FPSGGNFAIGGGMSDVPLKRYAGLQKTFASDIGGAANRKQIGDIYLECLQFLGNAEREELRSRIPGKSYFAFRSGERRSSAVNVRQFAPRARDWKAFTSALDKRDLSKFTPEKITEIIYSVAISFCCYVDLTKQRDQKTPGTFLEYLISHLFAWQLGVNPTT